MKMISESMDYTTEDYETMSDMSSITEKGGFCNSGLELGNKETAFFLSEQRSPEYNIVKRLHYLECPVWNCYFRIEKVLKTIRPKVHIFYLLFEHYRDKHYHLQKKEHTRFENLCYAILQELVVFEASIGKNEEKVVKRSIAVHNLLKHQGIGLRNVPA